MPEPLISVDYLLLGGTIITMNDSRDILKDAALAVKDNKIYWLGEREVGVSRFKPAKQLDLRNKVIIPGLINTHGHWAMTLFRGLLDDCTLENWLVKIWKVEADFVTVENVVTGAQLAMLEMIRSGTTCAGDMYWYYTATTDAAREAGFRVFNGPSFADIAGFENYKNTNTQIAFEYLDAFKDTPLVHLCVQAHSAYTTNPEILEQVAQISADRELVFTTHVSESLGELELVRERYGKSPIEVLDSFGLLGKRTLLAHCVHLSDKEIGLVAETGTSVAHCPSSNLKLSSGIARVADMVDAGVNVALGTDGAASNNTLDLFNEARIAALLQKGTTGDPTVLPAEKAFAMLTIDGARALGLGDVLGSIEVGKFADLAVIDFDSVNLTPRYNYYSHLIYAMAASDVCDVMVNGQLLMEDREMLTLDEGVVKAKAREIAQKIRLA